MDISKIPEITKFTAYNPLPPSNTQKIRIIKILEHNAYNEQLLCMDGEVCFKRTIIKQKFENWEKAEKILFKRK